MDLFVHLQQRNDPVPLIMRLLEIWVLTREKLDDHLKLTQKGKYAKSKGLGSKYETMFLKTEGLPAEWNKKCHRNPHQKDFSRF